MDASPSKSSYDVVVIGAGPAGLSAALHVLSNSPKPSLLLVDKQVPWEKPIACAEAVGKLGFREAVDVDPSWIRFNISKAIFHSPDGTAVTYTDKNKGHIINRALMQRDLLDRCRKRGADCQLNARVRSVSMPKEGGRHVVFDGHGVTCRVVIDASGPLSPFGKNEEIAWKPFDLEPAYFAVVKGLSLPTDAVHICVSRHIAPGGYAWIFPREEDSVNVGVLVGRAWSGSVDINRLLESFMRVRCPGGRVVQRFAGTIPCGYQRRAIAVHGLIKAGDAAGTINPISRAGIVEALMSGGIAGDFAVRLLGARSVRESDLLCKEYEKAWYHKRGRPHLKLSKVKANLARIPDSDYDRAARALAAISPEKLTMARIFRTSVGRFPRLVWALRHLM